MNDTNYKPRAIYKETLTGSAMHMRHSHAGFEVFQIWSSDTTVLVNDKIYTTIPGDIYFIDSHSLHWVKTPDDKPYERSAISFNREDVPAESYELLKLISCDKRDKSSYLLRLNREQAHHYDELFYKYASEKNNNLPYSSHMMRTTLCEILVNLNRDIIANYAEVIAPTKHNAYIQQTLDYINTHLTENISIDTIAQLICLNKHYLCHLFRTSTGTTINGYISSRRLHIAKQFLSTTDQTIEQVAVNVGYAGYSSFSQAFKRQYGISPKKYQKQFKPNH